MVRESVEEEKGKWESCNRTTAQATATNACRVIRQAAEALKLNADLLDHSILSGYGKAYTSKGIKDRLKVAKVTNTHALIPQVGSYDPYLTFWNLPLMPFNTDLLDHSILTGYG